MKIRSYLLLVVGLLSGTAFADISQTITYKSCDIHISGKIKNTYSVNQHTTRTDESFVNNEVMGQMFDILTSKGFSPYLGERRDGLSLRQKYTQNVNSSFGIYYHNIYAYLDIIENGEYSYFKEFRKSKVRNFEFKNYEYSLLKTIKGFPSCIEG